MKIRTYFVLLATPFFLNPLAARGQAATPVWATVTFESVSTAVVLPAGTTYRFGDAANNKWSTPITVTEATTFSPVFFPAGVFPFADPDSGTVKELDVLEVSAAQPISLTNLGVSPATTISQIVPSLGGPAIVMMPPGSAHTLTFSNFAIAPASGPNALMLAFVNEPTNMAYRTWEGTQMNLTIDGATLVCTYGQTYTDQVFTLNCTAPGAATP